MRSLQSMNPWPRRKFSLTVRTRRSMAERLLRLAMSRRYKSSFWSELAETADHFLVPSQGDQNALPDGVELVLRSVVFSDIYFAEEFDAAERGLRTLLRGARPAFSAGNSDKLRSFFDRATSRIGAGGTWNLSGLQLERFNPFPGTHIEHVHFLLSNPAPSFVVLVVVVTPSAKFRSSVGHLLSTQSHCDVDLSHVALRPFHQYFSSGSAVLRRQRELDELFLDLNAQIVRSLRRRVRAGMGMEGPLPFIEVYETNQAKSFFEQFRLPFLGVELATRNGFRALGLTEATYWAEEYLFNESRRDDHYNLSGWQAFLFKGDDIDGKAESPRFFYEALDIGPLIAIAHFHKMTATRAGRLRKKIAALMDVASPASPRKFLRHAWLLLPQARQTLYEQRRMSDELAGELRYLSLSEGKSITRHVDDDEKETPTLTADLRKYFSHTAAYTVTTLNDLVAAFRDFMDVGNMAVSYKVQRNVTILAFVALTAAILALDPERVTAWMSLVRSLLTWFGSG